MFSLSKESENSLKQDILKLIRGFLNNYTKPKPRLLDLITQQELRDELNISFNTLMSWEAAGLKRYQAPLEDGRKVFYRISDVLIFLGVENE